MNILKVNVYGTGEMALLLKFLLYKDEDLSSWSLLAGQSNQIGEIQVQ